MALPIKYIHIYLSNTYLPKFRHELRFQPVPLSCQFEVSWARSLETKCRKLVRFTRDFCVPKTFEWNHMGEKQFCREYPKPPTNMADGQ